MSVDHYENFPVASVLCPPAIRPAVAAIYHFARTADDIADEGTASTTERLAALAAYREDLGHALAGRPVSDRWPGVFRALALQSQRFQLPAQPLGDLLDAFVQDAGNPLYEDRAQLLDYCRRSANPVGRLLLHLYGIHDAVSLRESDAICSALQLINFWQDLSVDLPRGRLYIPLKDCAAGGVDPDDLLAGQDGLATRSLVANEVAWARQLMASGAPLATSLPGHVARRLGWELRLVVQGGLRILEKIAAMDYASIRTRPRLHRSDAPRLLWRALRMT